MSDSVYAHSGLRRRRKAGKRAETLALNESYLPDDVVIDILSRLPAKDVLRYRCVCTGWRDLTSTEDFTDLHFRRCLPMLLKDTYPLTLNSKDPTMLDGCWKPARTKSTILKVYKPYEHGPIHFSHNGLIASSGGRNRVDFVIYNPIYTDVVNICTEPYRGEVCGVFFHPVRQEFCTLWELYTSFEPSKLQYKILNLESNPKWRDIRNPCKTHPRISGISPVLIGKHLYWRVQNFTANCDIVEYDIRKEEFRVLSSPARVNNWTYNNLDVVDNDGVVSVVTVIPSKGLIEIKMWTLMDDMEQLWTCFHNIIYCDVFTPRRFKGPKALAFWNGELVIHYEGRLYVCDLKLGTCRKFGQKYSSTVKFLSHVTSLVSLKNCKSNIFNVEKDENNHGERGNGEEIKTLPDLSFC